MWVLCPSPDSHPVAEDVAGPGGGGKQRAVALRRLVLVGGEEELSSQFLEKPSPVPWK